VAFLRSNSGAVASVRRMRHYKERATCAVSEGVVPIKKFCRSTFECCEEVQNSGLVLRKLSVRKFPLRFFGFRPRVSLKISDQLCAFTIKRER
jgi:hypothetical protein